MFKKVLALGVAILLSSSGILWAAEAMKSDAKAEKPPVISPAISNTPVAAPAVEKAAAPEPAAEKQPVPAEGTATLQVETAAIATAIENREPQGAAESFPVGTEKLYCYTKLTGGKEGDTVIHKWMKGKDVVAEVTLKVNGSPWRTFSSKTLPEDAAGQWTVEIIQGEQVLKTLNFEVK